MVQLFWFHCSIKLDVTKKKKKDLNRLLDIGSATMLNENTTQKVRGEREDKGLFTLAGNCCV